MEIPQYCLQISNMLYTDIESKGNGDILYCKYNRWIKFNFFKLRKKKK